jgi:hypothetical protein
MVNVVNHVTDMVMMAMMDHPGGSRGRHQGGSGNDDGHDGEEATHYELRN